MAKQESDYQVIYSAWPPVESPRLQGEDYNNTNNDNSVNAVSFGFVATAILISMFLVMAIFERFLRPTSHGGGSHDPESQIGFNAKLGQSSPKTKAYAHEVSVLMPGDNVPTFIAHPVPVPCASDHISSTCKQETPNSNTNFSSSSSSGSGSIQENLM